VPQVENLLSKVYPGPMGVLWLHGREFAD